MKTPEQFKQAIEQRNITFFVLRDCSICHADFGFIFARGEIFVDTNCNCCPFNPMSCRKTNFEYLAGIYNQESEESYFRIRANWVFFDGDKNNELR